MKVTALIPDSLVKDVQRHSMGKNITDSLIIALREWLATKKLRALNLRVQRSPLKFSAGFSAANIRALNRRR